MHKVNAIDFHLFLLRLGFRNFFEGFYYFKWLEYPLVYNHLNLIRGQYLDIGSGKSSFPLFVLLKTNSVVHIIDDQSNIKDSLGYYKTVINKMKLNRFLDNRLFLHGINEGVINFDFLDNSFDNISCISVLEHIRNDGDSMMMKNIVRILKKKAGWW